MTGLLTPGARLASVVLFPHPNLSKTPEAQCGEKGLKI